MKSRTGTADTATSERTTASAGGGSVDTKGTAASGASNASGDPPRSCSQYIPPLTIYVLKVYTLAL